MMNIEKFRLLDEIYEISIENGTLVSQMQVPKVSSVLNEHFPGNSIVPGVILIEIMAQSSGNLIMAKLDFNKMAVLAKVSHCKFAGFVVPGDKLICSTKLLKYERGFTVNQAEITRDGVVMAKAELRMKVLDFFCELAKKTLVSNFHRLTKRTMEVVASDV